MKNVKFAKNPLTVSVILLLFAGGDNENPFPKVYAYGDSHP
jgi:hypothetical protein